MQIIPPDETRHGHELAVLMAEVFSQHGYYRVHDACLGHYIINSHYDWRASRIGILDERIVSHFGVWDFNMRIGRARVRVGGVGSVATHGNYRKRGLVSRIARDSLQAMRQCGYDLTLLFGIPDFYDRFGYVRAWPTVTFIVSLDELPGWRPPARTRRMRAGDLADIAKLYNQQNKTATGTAVRPTFDLRRLAFNSCEGHLWKGPDRQTAGYVIVGKPGQGSHELVCTEYAGNVEETVMVLARLARQRLCREIRFASIPYNSDLCKWLRQRNCCEEIRHCRCRGAMIRTVGLKSTLSKMSAELSQRLRHSLLRDWRGILLIKDKREEVGLHLDRSGVRINTGCRSRHMVSGGEEIVQLLIGTDNPLAIVESAGLRCTGDAKLLLQVLFPCQHPVLSQWDHF